MCVLILLYTLHKKVIVANDRIKVNGPNGDAFLNIIGGGNAYNKNFSPTPEIFYIIKISCYLGKMSRLNYNMISLSLSLSH